MSVIPDPKIDPENAPYFEAANRRELLLGLCADCGQHHHYPRSHCPICGSREVSTIVARGTGVVYSKSAFVRASEPYTLAWVELEEGPGFLTNIIDSDSDEVAIGDPVRVTYRPSVGGQLVPMVVATDTQDSEVGTDAL